MEFLADLSALDEMMGYIRTETSKQKIEEKAARKIELACEEALVNVISYAYPQLKGKIFIECARRGYRFEITLRDQGVPFNPMDVEINPQLDKPVHERRIGGLGIYLLRKTIDEVSYQREGQENILRMAFRI